MPLESHVISGGEYSRSAWYCPGPSDQSHPLCIFLDGEHYHRDMAALPILEKLLAEPGMPPLSLLFISHVGTAADQQDYAACRTADYTCNDRYARFIAEDVVRWATARSAGTQAEGNLICGLSLSGLQSAYITFRHPRVFRACLSQSGSFWWLADRDVRLPTTQARFWLSVGDQETATRVAHAQGLFQEISQMAGVERAAEEFSKNGATVHYHRFAGGHAIAPWQAELPEALRWLMATS